MSKRFLEKLEQFREKAKEYENRDTSDIARIHFGISDEDSGIPGNGDGTLSYHPSEEELVIIVRPRQFKRGTAETMLQAIASEFGRDVSSEEVGELEGPGVIEYTATVKWSPS